MKMCIENALNNMRIAAIKKKIPWDIVDELDNKAIDEWCKIYSGISSGRYSIAYWDDKPIVRPGYKSFMRYALHRSTKQNGFLQLSVMQILNDEIIPTSDTQHDTVQSFLRETPGCAVVNIIPCTEEQAVG